tara:strand:+ start:1663 stop:2466 length:804 start_codon:yes stop_codon:yes gene_type:complete
MLVKLVDLDMGDREGLGNKNKDFAWSKTETGICVYTGQCLNRFEMSPSSVNIAWIIEPYELNPHPYNYIRANYDKFKNVLTPYKEFNKTIPNAVYVPFGTTWIDDNSCDIYDKTKDVSIIASFKKQMYGQVLRHECVERFGNSMDVGGNGYQKLESKLELLKDYRYSVVIENVIKNGWFTEKLIDCFRTGTIPIYFGDGDIANIFDINGMYTFKSLDGLETILNGIETGGEEIYNNRMTSIENNYILANEYSTPEEVLWDYYFKDMT